MDNEKYDANHHLEILPGDEGGFRVWLFDYLIGEGATESDALDEAKANIRRWTGEP